MTRRGAADLCASLTGAVVLFVGVTTLLGDADVLAPSSKTTVTKPAVPAATDTKTTKTTEPVAGKGKPKTTTVVDTTTSAAKPEEATTTEQEGERTLAERLLGSGGIVVLQIAALVLAAFIAAAAVQRVIVGQYGFKFGGFELGELADQSAKGIEALNVKVDAVTDDVAGLKDGLSVAYNRILIIEDEIEDS